MSSTSFFAAIAVLFGLTSVAAASVEVSARPQARPVDEIQTAQVTVQRSARPRIRPDVSLPAPVPEVTKVASNPAGFGAWVKSFRRKARAAGITDRTYDLAFRNAAYDPDIVRRDRSQAEFTKILWDYLDKAVSDTRIRNGKAALRKYRTLLDRIEAKYGVDKEVVVAVWGLESSYGAIRGSTPVIGAMATLAYDGRRAKFFENELIHALRILQSGVVSASRFTGSWAGAMGHTQFMPSSYSAFAVDFDGKRGKDIWSDDPTDALASTAAYLSRNGWRKGTPWGVEVKLPKGFDYRLAKRSIKRMPSDWAKLGITDMSGKPVRDYGSASVLVPAGSQGAAFLIFKNFKVIETYNTADAYVIAVGHLADRLRGGPGIKAKWPRGDRVLTFAERKELQRRLKALGLYSYNIDAKMGPLTIEAVRAFQMSRGMTPDGYPSLRILQKLR
ncbi:lytic murein transglycosylase [Pseudoprimorskyibacter insulae]|uniref:Membrane-bound lytic murein transglycosylase B n=1 Tax=Pseudoprimorskyibacter insulae TaxID=1695997 RepID=A0A2R8AUC2_9RHOB|nr:lytic murein transglycosylase [Pseudoprimorskyibacter insulae]SPF79632.1 Membrane-bound lytic murein transglycosylase B [Pseudoprimorskyibacter insulae]